MVFGISSNYVLCTEELDKTRLVGGGDKRVDLSIVEIIQRSRGVISKGSRFQSILSPIRRRRRKKKRN